MSHLPTFAAGTPTASMFRVFNYLGWENFAAPQFGTQQADLFYCGPDLPQARQVVEQLISDIGLRPVRVGGAERAQLFDGLPRLWFALAAKTHARFASEVLCEGRKEKLVSLLSILGLAERLSCEGRWST